MPVHVLVLRAPWQIGCQTLFQLRKYALRLSVQEEDHDGHKHFAVLAQERVAPNLGHRCGRAAARLLPAARRRAHCHGVLQQRAQSDASVVGGGVHSAQVPVRGLAPH